MLNPSRVFFNWLRFKTWAFQISYMHKLFFSLQYTAPERQAWNGSVKPPLKDSAQVKE